MPRRAPKYIESEVFEMDYIGGPEDMVEDSDDSALADEFQAPRRPIMLGGISIWIRLVGLVVCAVGVTITSLLLTGTWDAGSGMPTAVTGGVLLSIAGAIYLIPWLGNWVLIASAVIMFVIGIILTIIGGSVGAAE